MTDEIVARVVLFVVMGATGVMLIWMARAAASGRLRRNGFVGIRTPSTMTSDEAWLAAHRRAERPTQVAGVVSLVVALIAVLPVSENVLVGGVLAGSVVVLAIVIHGAVVGGRAAREVEG